MSIPAAPWLHRLLPLFGRRLVVLDPGRNRLRAIVVDARFGSPRVTHFQTFNLTADTPEGQELVEEQLDAFLAAAGPHERWLVMPQYRAISQVVDLPGVAPADLKDGLALEARRLSGLEEGALAFDAVKLHSFGRLLNPHWLTLCKREELDALLARFAGGPEAAAIEPARWAGVTTSGQALFAAARVLLPSRGHGVVVDLRENNSVLAIVVGGQGVNTTTIPVGTRQFGEALGLPRDRDWAMEAEIGLAPDGTVSVPATAGVIEKWLGEVRLAVSEWIEDNPDSGVKLAEFRVFLCGLGVARPGLLEFLNARSPLRFEAWEDRVSAGSRWPMADYLVAYGAALVALGGVSPGVSLLPEDAQVDQRRQRRLAALHTTNMLLLGVVLTALGLGVWQKWSLIQRKQGLTQQSQGALQTALQIDQLYRQLNIDYERVYPVLQRQRETLDTLQALAAVQAARTNTDHWYVLFADAASYQAGTSGLAQLTLSAVRPPGGTNLPPVAVPERREFIVEVCVPREGEALRRVLGDVVANLKHDVLFQRVDALSPERKRDLVDPKVAVSNRVFAVAMEVAGRRLPVPAPLPERPRPASSKEPRRLGGGASTPTPGVAGGGP